MIQHRPDPQRLATLRLVHGRAVERSQELARALGEARAQCEQARQQLRNLQRFAAQYRGDLAALEGSGADWARLRDMRAFIARLDSADAAQHREIERLDALQAQRGHDWAQARKREKVFALLIERHQDAARAFEVQRELKEIQEWTMQASSTASASGTAQEPSR